MNTLPLSSQLIYLCAAVMLLLSFAMIAQRRVLTLVNLLALQGATLCISTLLVAYSTGQHHLYYSAALTLALKGASEEIRQRFFNNMSKRAADMLKEEMEVLGAVRLRDVEKAQQDIVAIARKLEEEGIIVTGAAAGEAYVV